MDRRLRLTLLEIVLLGIGVASGFLFLAFHSDLPLVVRAYLKMVPTLLMAVWILSRRVDRTNWAALVGLLFACAGDVAMEIGDPTVFVVGIALNMLSLVFYTVYFVLTDRSWDLWRLVPFVVVLGAVYALLFPGLGTYAIPIGGYCLIYMAFLWRSSARIGDPNIGMASQGLCFSACLMITLSDSLLGIQLFHPVEAWYTSPYLSMFLWWAGQLLMTVTAELGEKRRQERKRAEGLTARVSLN